MKTANNPLGFTLDYKPINIILREESPVDEFYTENITPAHDSNTAVCIMNPLYMLFNSERIELAGSFATEKWIQQLNSASSSFDSLKELRAKCSDDDLIKYMKSRYLQQPCEIAAWASYIDENIDKFSKELQQYVEANKTDSEIIEQSSQNSE